MAETGVNEYYKKLGYDFSSMSDDDKERMDQIVKMASEQPIVTRNGEMQYSDGYKAIMAKGGMSTATAKKLALYGAWRSGVTPKQLDAEMLQRNGVPADQIEKNAKEREAEWQQGLASRFGNFINPELDKKEAAAKKKPVMEMEPEEISAPAPKGAAGAQQTAPAAQPEPPVPVPQNMQPEQPLPPQQQPVTQDIGGNQWKNQIMTPQGYQPAQLVNEQPQVNQ